MSVQTNSDATSRPVRVATPRNFETRAWLFMRYSGVLLIPLALSHIILNDVIVGVHAIDLSVVAERWSSLGWRLYSASLLVFAFAHGMNGVRQVAMDYIKNERTFRTVSWILLILWFVISMMGAIALVAGVRQ